MFHVRLRCSILTLIIILVKQSWAWTARGCVDLDSSTFDKVVGKFDYALVKFDTAFPYGDKHEAFTKLAEEVAASNDLLFALVGIKDYGEKDNADLGKRFSIPKEYPAIKLFARNAVEPIDFPADQAVTVENLRIFLKRYTDLYIGLPGCTQELDNFANTFLTSVPSTVRSSIIDQVETIEKSLDETDPLKKSYIMYAALMRKINNSDKLPEDIVQEEMKRIQKILQGKLSDTKRAELKLRINIMLSFQSNQPSIIKSHSTEL
ncbi:protein windbeutel [Anopheles bellator]|uniref:protein windbeutel n=1 Tax=Anopheles bellator TaxID=139047 RepID=UPI002648190A|nr:protein windbeutel [Anopheles bellator]XP_058063712.1 protein windbeutel [Anopheles bellator]